MSQARAIVRDGFVDEKWSFVTDDVGGEPLKMVGVWLTDRPASGEDAPPGAATLEITLALPEAALGTFEVQGVLAEAQLWIVPARVVNQHSGIRISGVDARSSWFHERIEEGEEDS